MSKLGWETGTDEIKQAATYLKETGSPKVGVTGVRKSDSSEKKEGLQVFAWEAVWPSVRLNMQMLIAPHRFTAFRRLRSVNQHRSAYRCKVTLENWTV